MKTLHELALDYFVTQDMMVVEDDPDRQVCLENHLEQIDGMIKRHPDYKKRELEDGIMHQIPTWPE